MHSEKSSLVLIVMLFRSKACLRYHGCLEQVRLRVDPLKDAAGSPFGKADRLYLYLHVQKLCVEWGSTNTAGTSMFKISHIHKV